MKARMKNPAMALGDVATPLWQLGKNLADSSIPATTRTLIDIRTSQINGCASCIDAAIKKTTETPQRLAAIAVWREAPFFTPQERAALALTEAITKIGSPTEGVTDAVWAEAAAHYDEQGMAWLVLQISTINLYNRLNVATKQVAGAQSW
jgi:AhpD family alkylhydroperoxidase